MAPDNAKLREQATARERSCLATTGDFFQDPRAYAKIRRGGDLERVLKKPSPTCATARSWIPKINVEVNCILNGDTHVRLEEFAEPDRTSSMRSASTPNTTTC